MKHASQLESAGETKVKLPTRRTLAKQQTRAKVLAAARRLFSEQGYEGATIRDIATAAGMSTGAVFANFTDKSDLFREIMFADMELLIAEMRKALEQGRTVEDALLKMFMAGYAFYKTQLPLARAAFGVSWHAEDGRAHRDAPQVKTMLELISGVLERGVKDGHLTADGDVALRTQMLFDTYLANFAQAIFDGWSLADLETRARGQIRILLAGARKA